MLPLPHHTAPHCSCSVPSEGPRIPGLLGIPWSPLISPGAFRHCRATVPHTREAQQARTPHRHVWDNFTSDTAAQAFLTEPKKSIFLQNGSFTLAILFYHFIFKKKLLLKAIPWNKSVSQCTLFFPWDGSSKSGARGAPASNQLLVFRAVRELCGCVAVPFPGWDMP